MKTPEASSRTVLLYQSEPVLIKRPNSPFSPALSLHLSGPRTEHLQLGVAISAQSSHNWAAETVSVTLHRSELLCQAFRKRRNGDKTEHLLRSTCN
uniref:Uncharacterized protein n=1 Tax=Peronospora matthiolae TaxID=2874970 RepID=A0AAV1ULT7_9STRA